ncbi:MAG TPA: PilN domain-containing protein [Patescibacteria group bacterium]|nr:PilN domain-containing protein [Patescibacteria group bacterium]
MIQINLLPEVKTKYIKAERTKHLVFVSSAVISSVVIGVVIIMASVVYGAQRLRLNSLDSNIKKNSSKLQQIDGLDKILTIQNQLNSLPALHSQKPVTSRLFTFLPQITPNDVQIAKFTLSYDTSTITIDGTAGSLESVNKFADTLKFTKFTTDQNQNQNSAFSQVVLTSFARTDKSASYTITMSFDPAIFSSDNKTVTLVVPKMTTTRSETEQPPALFKSQTSDNSGQAVR